MEFLHLSEIIEFCQVESVANKLSPNYASRWRSICRSYSKLFSTPYHEVLKMDAEFVILAVFEEELDEINPIDKVHELMDRVFAIEDPDYQASQERDLQDFIKDAEEEEEARIKQGKPVYVPPKKKSKEKSKELPKEGFIDLSYLEKEDQ